MLTSGKLNVVSSAGFASFRLELRNSGSSPQNHVEAKLVISRGTQGRPITKTDTLGSINPAQTATVTFTNVGKVPLVTPTNLTVEVGGLSRAYSVVFTPPD